MNTKAKIMIAGVSLLAAFAIGRYSAQQAPSVKSEVSSEEQKSKNTHVQTTTTETKSPDGTVTRTTTTDRVSSSESSKKEDVKTEVVAAKRSTINISALGGYNFQDKKAFYGASASKEVLGPVTAGIWGLNNGTVGLSVGLDF